MARHHGGPGSNQHQTKPTVAPRSVSSQARTATASLATVDPMVEEWGSGRVAAPAEEVVRHGQFVHGDVVDLLGADPDAPVSVWFSADIGDGSQLPRATFVSAPTADGGPAEDDVDEDVATQIGRWARFSGLSPVRLGGREVEFSRDGNAVLVGASPEARCVPPRDGR